MRDVAMIGLVDARGWLLLQERDEHAPVAPNQWCLVGGGVEPGEDAATAARRELVEETGLDRADLVPLGTHVLPCPAHGHDRIGLFTGRADVTDDDIDCREGRQIVFVDPAAIAGLDLTDSTRALYHLVLGEHRA